MSIPFSGVSLRFGAIYKLSPEALRRMTEATDRSVSSFSRSNAGEFVAQASPEQFWEAVRDIKMNGMARFMSEATGDDSFNKAEWLGGTTEQRVRFPNVFYTNTLVGDVAAEDLAQYRITSNGLKINATAAYLKDHPDHIIEIA